MRLVGLRRVDTERQVPTTRLRCCPRRKDRLGWDGVAMVTESVLQPRSQDGPPNGVPRSFPGVVDSGEGHFFKNLNQVLPKLVRKQRADLQGTMKWAYVGLRLEDLGA